MEAQTAKEVFEKDLPSRFKSEKAEGIDVVAQLNISGAKGGNWTVLIKDKKLQVKEGTHPEPQITLNFTDADFIDIVNKKISAEKAFFSGRIQFKGNITTALKLKDAGLF
ncbi:MAG: SCP2 sterol-binding domain-containing protein [Candidatus Bathyarchaeota archaeon]|nr:SCP2 sterol-binding domain-containing protein [Candidatus Bathyarchaeota archaeon]